MRDVDFSEVTRQFDKAILAHEDILAADDAAKLRNAWEDFLHAFHRTVGRLISIGLNDPSKRSWGYKLKNASNGDDEGLFFLREARAHAEHGLGPFADFRNPHVSVGGNLVSIGGNSTVTFAGNIINGRPMGDFHIQTERGRVKQLSGAPKVALEQKGAQTKLLPIRSEQKNKVVPVPRTICGRELIDNDPIVLASESLEALRNLIVEFKAL